MSDVGWASAAAILITATVAGLVLLMKTRSGLRLEEDTSTGGQYRQILHLQREQLAAVQAELDQIHDEHSQCRVDLASQYGWMLQAHSIIRRLSPSEQLDLPPPPKHETERTGFVRRTNQQNTQLVRDASAVVLPQPPPSSSGK